MTVQGRDCLVVIKTQYREMSVPYAEETIREAVSLLTEEAAIEGGRLLPGHTEKHRGYRVRGNFFLELLPAEDSTRFDLIQDQDEERRVFGTAPLPGLNYGYTEGKP